MEYPKINVIFDDRRPEKYDKLIAEFKRQGITDFEIWPCILRPRVVESINLNFKMIVRDAKEKGLKEVCIAEDDLMFPSKNGWKYFLESKPTDFDVYIGGTYLIDKPEDYKPRVVKVKEWVGNQLIMVNEKYYDRFLSVPDGDHIDTVHSGLGDFYVCFPFAALQRPGFSNNNMAEVNYNSNLNEAWIYNI